jgi:hypothetical protein
MLSRAVYVRDVPRRPSKSQTEWKEISPGIKQGGWIADEDTIFVDAGPEVPWGPFLVRAYIDTTTGVPRCVGFDIRSFHMKHEDGITKFSAGPSGGVAELTASKLREVPFGRVVSASVWGLSRLMDILGSVLPAEHEAGLKERQRLYDQHARRYDYKHFERVAKIYTRATEKGWPPTQEVARELGISRSAAAKQVSRCRNELGLLPRTSQGRAGIGAPPTKKQTTTKKQATRKKGQKR